MDISAVQALILATIATWGATVVVILTAVIGIGVAYLVFRFGWKKTKGSLK